MQRDDFLYPTPGRNVKEEVERLLPRVVQSSQNVPPPPTIEGGLLSQMKGSTNQLVESTLVSSLSSQDRNSGTSTKLPEGVSKKRVRSTRQLTGEYSFSRAGKCTSLPRECTTRAPLEKADHDAQ